MFTNIRSPFPYQATVGIDWADQTHDVFVRFANGDTYRRKIDSRPEAIQEWLLELRSACAEGKIAIALEQRRGALFYHLCTHLCNAPHCFVGLASKYFVGKEGIWSRCFVDR